MIMVEMIDGSFYVETMLLDVCIGQEQGFHNPGSGESNLNPFLMGIYTPGLIPTTTMGLGNRTPYLSLMW